MIPLLIGCFLSFIIGFAAYKKRALSQSGFAAAVFLGTVIYLCGGLLFWLSMIAFFISSSLLSFVKSNRKDAAQKLNDKGGRRDALQVLANGTPAMMAAILYYFYQQPIFLAVFATAFAASNADTWASEIGVLRSRPPVSIINFKPMTAGASGAVSPLGTGAALLGALFIALVFCVTGGLFFKLPILTPNWLLLITLGGFAGCLTDSLLGALIQAQYRCVSCGKLTEKNTHHNQTALLIKGHRFINNDMVNFLSGLTACVLVASVFMLII